MSLVVVAAYPGNSRPDLREQSELHMFGWLRAFALTGDCPQPSAPDIHSRFGVRPVRKALLVGEHTPEPA